MDGVPLPFLTHAHELAIALVVLILGAPAIFGALPGQGQTGDPIDSRAWSFWGLSLTASWALTFWGVFRARPRAEWTGQLIAGYGLAFWAAILWSAVGIANVWPTVLVFGVLSAVSFWRAFKITSLSYIQHRLTQAARQAHVRATEERGGRGRE